MIRFLLFLRAWHAELRLWRYGIRYMMKLDGSLTSQQLEHMENVVNRYWIDFSQGYVRIR